MIIHVFQACGICSVVTSFIIFILVMFSQLRIIKRRKQKLNPIIKQLDCSYTKVPSTEYISSQKIEK